MDIRESAKNLFINLRGFKTGNKLVVIESDDWGSVRMPSKKAYMNLLKAGIRVDKCGYNTYDNLENVDDLTALLEIFQSIITPYGKRPILTANTIVANPDYELIRKNQFKKYDFEIFKESYLRYQGSIDTLNLIKEGISENLYYPQLHGREHVYINNWMSALQSNDPETMIAFNNQVYGLSTSITKQSRKSYLPALDFNILGELKFHEKILEDASTIFEDTFGFASESFIAPNYTWHPKHETIFKKIGIKYIQGGRAQKSPHDLSYQTIKHYMGKKNNQGLIYLIRNSSFEPSTKKNISWKKKILEEAKFAFALNAPLIISTHRVNFMGGLVEKNRTENLALFKLILNEMIKKYPDIEFITSNELGRRIALNK